MIFGAINEQGIPTWQLVLDGKKDVTRRLKPEPVGAIRAVQPNRGKKQIGKIKILSCKRHTEWSIMQPKYEPDKTKSLNKEAEREGFGSWYDLMNYFIEKGIFINDTYRIEFSLEKE